MDENDKAFVAHETKKEHWASESEPYTECRPSNVTDIPWLYIKRKRGEYPATTPKSGKWLIPLREAKLRRKAGYRRGQARPGLNGSDGEAKSSRLKER